MQSDDVVVREIRNSPSIVFFSAPLRAPTSSVAETATKPSHGRRGLPSASTSTHGSRRSTAISCWWARFDNNESPSFDLRGAAQQQPARRLIEAPAT